MDPRPIYQVTRFHQGADDHRMHDATRTTYEEACKRVRQAAEHTKTVCGDPHATIQFRNERTAQVNFKAKDYRHPGIKVPTFTCYQVFP